MTMADFTNPNDLTHEEYERLSEAAHQGAERDGALGRRNQAAHRRPLRRPRHRRQGRLDRHVRARAQPAPVPRRRACRRRASASRAQWYFQRYIEHLPAEGEIVLFDRSWYNRAGVEKVMGYCTPKRDRGLPAAPCPEFERHLVDDGILLFKYWLCCDQEMQEQRFAEPARQSDEALEAVADRYQGARPLRRLHRGAREDADGDAHRLRAVDPGRLQRPAASAG